MPTLLHVAPHSGQICWFLVVVLEQQQSDIDAILGFVGKQVWRERLDYPQLEGLSACLYLFDLSIKDLPIEALYDYLIIACGVLSRLFQWRK